MHWFGALACSLLLILPASGDPTWQAEHPVESIQGTYKLVKTEAEENPPMLATLWSVPDADFQIVAWPPKYCHAVHICFVDGKKRDRGTFQVEPDMCEESYVKFYPHIQRVDIKRKVKTDALLTLANHKNAVTFRSEGNGKTHLVIVDDMPHEKEADWKKRKQRWIQMKLMGKVILLLTNSRFCYAHLSSAGSVTSFDSLMDPSTFKDQNLLPTVLSSYRHPTGHPSIFVPPVENGEKTIDLLPVIQKATVGDTSKMRNKKKCTSFFSSSAQSSALSTIAVDSWQVQVENTNAAQREESFEIGLKKCSWLRLWVGPHNADMTSYKKDMKLKDTIDFFFDQQFMVGPDDDEARPMYGNSVQVGAIQIRRFRIQGSETIEVSYGRDRGPDFPFKEYFRMPSMLEPQFSLHIIRSPRCEATYQSHFMTMNLQSDGAPRTNVLAFKSCKRFILKSEG